MDELFKASIGKPPFKLENKDLIGIIIAFLIFLFISYFFIFLASHNFKEKLIVHYEKQFKYSKTTQILNERMIILGKKEKVLKNKTYEFPLMKLLELKVKDKNERIGLLIFYSDEDYFSSKIKEGFKVRLKFLQNQNGIKIFYPKKYTKNIKDSVNNIKFTTFLLSYLSLSDHYKSIKDVSIRRDIASLRDRDQNLDVLSFIVFFLLICLRMAPRLRKYFKRKKIFLNHYNEKDLEDAPQVEIANLSANESAFGGKYHKKDYFYKVVTPGNHKNLIVAFSYKKSFAHLSGKLLHYKDEYFFIPTGIDQDNQTQIN